MTDLAARDAARAVLPIAKAERKAGKVEALVDLVPLPCGCDPETGYKCPEHR